MKIIINMGFIFWILVCLSSCNQNKVNKLVTFSKIYISYFPSSQNYDFDSIKINNTEIIKIDSIFVGYISEPPYEREDKFAIQKLYRCDSNKYENITFNGANKPFVWQEKQVNNFTLPIDSVRRYLKNFILKKNSFNIYSKELGYQKIILEDTSKIVLKELYGGL